MVSYLSTQRPEDAPSGLQTARICWRESIPLVGEPPLIDVGKTAGNPARSLLSPPRS